MFVRLCFVASYMSFTSKKPVVISSYGSHSKFTGYIMQAVSQKQNITSNGIDDCVDISDCSVLSNVTRIYKQSLVNLQITMSEFQEQFLSSDPDETGGSNSEDKRGQGPTKWWVRGRSQTGHMTSECQRGHQDTGDNSSVKRVLLKHEDAKRHYFEIKLLELALKERRTNFPHRNINREVRSVNRLFKEQIHLFDNVKFEFEFTQKNHKEGVRNKGRNRTATKSAPPILRSNPKVTRPNTVDLHSCEQPALPLIAPDVPRSNEGVLLYGYVSPEKPSHRKMEQRHMTSSDVDVTGLIKRFPYVKFDQNDSNDLLRRDMQFTRMENFVCDDPTNKQFILISTPLPMYKKPTKVSTKYKSICTRL